MSKKHFLLVGLILWLAGLPGSAAAQDAAPEAVQAAVGTAFSYQGQLRKAGGPVNGTCDMTFRLYDAATLGTPVGSPQVSAVPVANGLFTVVLDFGGAAFSGDARWLEVAVKCAGDTAFTTLSPRQSITPAPYALALPGVRIVQNAESPNVIGGSPSNSVASGEAGSVIAGGGTKDYPNRTLGGYNVVAGGVQNAASGPYSVVGGGAGNTAAGAYSVVAGGWANMTNAPEATVAGGFGNSATAWGSTVPGGLQAVASHFGEMAYASGGFSSPGDAQTSFYVLRGEVPNTQNSVELFLDGSLERLSIAGGRAVAFDMLIVARGSAGESSAWRFEGLIENDAGTVRFVGTPTKTTLGEDDISWDAAVYAQSGALVIRGFSMPAEIRSALWPRSARQRSRGRPAAG
jgi:hypothetical protein